MNDRKISPFAKNVDNSKSRPVEGRQGKGQLRRILLHVCYDGTGYSGFAFQNNARAISNAIQDALRDIDPEASMLTCASRTDAGVHSAGQPVSFASTKNLHSRGWVLALAQRLPPDISVVRAGFVPLDFDPRRDPLHKRYRYTVFRSQVEDPFLSRIAWRVGQPLSLECMKNEAKHILGEHDFSAYRNIGDRRTETIRRIDFLNISTSSQDSRCLDIDIQGNRFMYNMVRIIAGTLVEVGKGRVLPGAFRRAFASGSRRDLGMTAPARGLCLQHVELRTQAVDSWPDGSDLSASSGESVLSQDGPGVE